MNKDAPKVVVAGSLHYDIFVTADRRPATGETLSGKSWQPKFGGKGGNQAVAAAKAGCTVTMVGAVGDDSFAPFLLEHLQQAHIDTQHIATIPHCGSGMSVALSDGSGDYSAVIVSGANLKISATHLQDNHIYEGAGALILQNEVSEETNIIAATQAHKHGLLVCLNAAPVRSMSPEFSRLIDVLIVNQIEAEGISGQAVNDLNSAEQAALALTARFPHVVVTAGGSGVAYASATNTNEQARHSENCQATTTPAKVLKTALHGQIPAKKVKLISTHGAGDCFVGHLCAALIQGKSLADACAHANEQAAIHVSTPISA